MKLIKILLVAGLAGLLSACVSDPVSEAPIPETVVSDDIIKSPNDTRDYRFLILPNGLKLLLISDAKADKAAAALAVYRGSFDDPLDRPGLAHFLEHMLFIGTEKYPEPDGYFSYVQAHGGSSNAYTSSEVTNYFFDIQPQAFREGLDRFAHFFISPLFQKEYVEREKNAVNSEYKMQIKDDGWRGFVAQKVAVNPEHPVSRFNIGTLDTLDGDVHGALLAWFESHYSANQMGLVVLSNETLDDMQPWITELFSQIENRDLANIERKAPIFTAEGVPATLRHDNLKDTYGVSYSWEIPSLDDHYRTKPVQYLANLVGHEGDGSLHKLLTEKGWINSLSAGESRIDDNHAMMNVDISLTEAGAAHVPEISAYLFAYLDMLRANEIEAWIYREQSIAAELAFRFAEKSSAIGAVRTLAPLLERLPPRDLLVAPYLMETFDADLIAEYLSHLRADKVMMTVSSPGYEGGKTESWFDVRYDLERSPIALAAVDVAGLRLPEPNPFLPESLSLTEADDDMPLPVIQGEAAEIYVDTDLEFLVPRAVTLVSLRNPGGLISLEDATTAAVYTMLVQDDLNALAYPALLAGVNYRIGSPPKGFRISIGGYEDKQLVLLDEVLRRLITLDIDPDRFATLRIEMLKSLRNASKNRPFRQAYGRIQDELVNAAWTPEAQIPVVEAMTPASVTAWRDQIFSNVSLQALIHGNVQDEKADALLALVEQHVALTNVAVSEPQVAVISGKNQTDLAIDHADAVMALYVQNDAATLEHRAGSALFTHLIAPKYFSSLRTDQQLGYVVNAAHTVFYEQGGVTFLVQSPVVGPAEIKARTLAFLDAQAERLTTMSNEEFGANKGGLISSITQRDKNLAQRASRYWLDLDRGVTTFDGRQQLAKAVSELYLSDMQVFVAKLRHKVESDYLLVYSNGKFGE